jgi:hypothetical protein
MHLQLPKCPVKIYSRKADYTRLLWYQTHCYTLYLPGIHGLELMVGHEGLLRQQQNSSTSPLTAIVSKLRCTDCQRTDFPTLQGLMNHCRMAHHKSYNTHEDCVAACAIPVEDEDEREWIMTNGTEIAAGPEVSRPSLQRLFARAVGEKPRPSPTPSAVLANTTSSEISTVKNEPQDEEMPSHEHSSLVQLMTENSATPRHSQHSSALAKLLGKELRRRDIKTVDEVGAIDIGYDVENHTTHVTPRWRMRYSVRSGAAVSSPEDTRSAVDDTDIPDATLLDTRSPRHISPTLESTESRFHITARIVITDKSRWIPPGKSIPTNVDYTPLRLFLSASRFNAHTHQWMVTVTSPSYVTLSSSTPFSHRCILGQSHFNYHQPHFSKVHL